VPAAIAAANVIRDRCMLSRTPGARRSPAPGSTRNDMLEIDRFSIPEPR
jgi:hypothetical protein